jgi:hypothetical protein
MRSFVRIDPSTRPWIWILLMAFATVWYAWPQLVYSLFPAYELARVLFPGWTEGLQPWVEGFRQGIR